MIKNIRKNKDINNNSNSNSNSNNTSTNKIIPINQSNQNNQNQKKIIRNGSFSKVLEKRGNLEIRIINSVLKKDIHGYPFLEYICEVKKGEKNYKINKKFGHFIMLHKALKSLFKENLKLTNVGNLFININEMKNNAFHENKLEQLDKYVSDLLNIDEVKNSIPFKNFFELDDIHDSNSSNDLGK